MAWTHSWKRTVTDTVGGSNLPLCFEEKPAFASLIGTGVVGHISLLAGGT